MESKQRWEAIGAVAGVLSVLIALATWAAQGSQGTGSQPPPSPHPYTSPIVPPSPDSSAVSTTDQSPSIAPPSTVSAGRPAGCDESYAAIDTFESTWAASSTVQARAGAASSTEQELMSASLSAVEPVYSLDIALEHDFLALASDLEDGESGSDALALANADIATLKNDCNVG